MEFMNGLRKVASKKLVINVQNKANTTMLQNMIINYEVNIFGENAGLFNIMKKEKILLCLIRYVKYIIVLNFITFLMH